MGRTLVLVVNLAAMCASLLLAVQNAAKPEAPAKPAAKAPVAVEVPAPFKFVADKTSNRLTLESPNGKHRISLTADNEGASIWISGERDTGAIALLHGFGCAGPAVGIYSPGKNQIAMTAALAAYDCGGQVQLCETNAPPRFLTSTRLEEIQNVIYPPAKAQPKAEPAEPVPLRE